MGFCVQAFGLEMDTLDDAMYYEFLCEKLPQRLVEPFYENTKYNKTVGQELLAIGQQESEWKFFVVLKSNKNGTTDQGPLGLNSSHFSEVWFQNVVRKYADKYLDDSDICFMIAGIYYYRDLRSQMGTYAAYRQYNGGPTANKKYSTKEYADSVSKKEAQIAREYEAFKETNKERVTKKFNELKTYLSNADKEDVPLI